jgi:hypothetical protein
MVRYRIESAPLGVIACHCVRCRKQSGSAYSVNLLVSPAALTMIGTPRVFIDTDTSSGSPVYREFCGACGSPIRSVLGANPDVVLVKAGTLDDADPYAPGLHVFTRSKLGWVEVPAAAPQFPENPG